MADNFMHRDASASHDSFSSPYLPDSRLGSQDFDSLCSPSISSLWSSSGSESTEPSPAMSDAPIYPHPHQFSSYQWNGTYAPLGSWSTFDASSCQREGDLLFSDSLTDAFGKAMGDIVPEHGVSVMDPLDLYISTTSLDLQLDAEGTKKSLPCEMSCPMASTGSDDAAFSYPPSAHAVTMQQIILANTGDDEGSTFIPSSPRANRKRTPRETRISSSSASPHSFPNSPHRSSQQKNKHLVPSEALATESTYDCQDNLPIEIPGRLKQATDSSPNYYATNAAGDFECQVCVYVCKRERKADFKRHVAKHYRDLAPLGGPVICCGVPIAQRKLARYQRRISPDAEEMSFYGLQMVGGCGKMFSRTDSLKRHLRLPRGHCVGDLKGDWHPPKKSCA